MNLYLSGQWLLALLSMHAASGFAEMGLELVVAEKPNVHMNANRSSSVGLSSATAAN